VAYSFVVGFGLETLAKGFCEISMLNLVLFILAIAISLGIGYVIARKVIGPEAAKRNLFYSGPWILFGAFLALLLPSVGRYGLVALYAIYVVSILTWLFSWPLRKKEAGALLLEVGPTVQNKLLFWIGLLQIGTAIAMTLSLIDNFTGPLTTTGGIVSGIIKITFWWTIALTFIFLGRSHLEIRENGLTYFFTWQPWARIKAFGWDDDKPNTLILKAAPRTVLSRRYITLSIPSAQQPEVDRLLEDYLLETDLASEMDGEVANG